MIPPVQRVLNSNPGRNVGNINQAFAFIRLSPLPPLALDLSSNDRLGLVISC